MIAIPIVLAAIIGYMLATDQSERYLPWRLLAFGVLGYFTLPVRQVVVPVGFLLVLVAGARSRRNKRALIVTGTLTCLLWLLSYI
jgi:TctA family transporter